MLNLSIIILCGNTKKTLFRAEVSSEKEGLQLAKAYKENYKGYYNPALFLTTFKRKITNPYKRTKYKAVRERLIVA